jgi:cytochrome c-type protein NapB
MSETPATSKPGTGRKLAVVAVLISLTLGLSGFFMGLRQTELAAVGTRPTLANPSAVINESPEVDVPVAPRYAELHEGKLRPNKDWVVHLATLSRPAPEAQYTVAALTPAEIAHLRATRTTRRQYDGAPPVAPHPLDQLTPAACLECHGKPTKIGKVQAPLISHPAYTNCIQCHVSSSGPTSTWVARHEALSEGNKFVGKEQSGQGKRAYVGAPPVISHTTWMRDNCMSCHGPGGTAALRTSHPNRQSCTQCHAVNAELDSRLASGLPPPLPISDWKTNANN